MNLIARALGEIEFSHVRGCLKKDFVASASGFSTAKADVQIATLARLDQVEERFG